MHIQIEIKENPKIFTIAEVSINSQLPELICRCSNRSEDDDEPVIESLESVISGIRISSTKAFFGYDSDRILDAAGRYYIIHDYSIGYRYAGLANPSDTEDRRYARIRSKKDNETVIHELIHLAYDCKPHEVLDDIDPESLYHPRENAIEIATKLFLYHIPRLPEDIKDVQIEKVMKAFKKYRFLDHFKTPEDIDRNSRFFREKLNEQTFSEEEAFNFNGMFNNFYWDEIRATLINGNFVPPVRQKFLFS